MKRFLCIETAGFICTSTGIVVLPFKRKLDLPPFINQRKMRRDALHLLTQIQGRKTAAKS